MNIRWDLGEFSNIKSLRWNPIENKWCRLKLEKVKCKEVGGVQYELDLDIITHNGIIDSDGWIVFKNNDSMIFFPVDSDMEYILIQGKIGLIEQEFDHDIERDRLLHGII